MNAAALIVGVNQYDGIDAPLTGCLADAFEALEWLLEIGVAPERIHFLTSPQVTVSPLTGMEVPAGVHFGDARREAIGDALAELMLWSGDQLFIFFSGHGLHAGEAKSIFLASDFNLETKTDRNIPIEPLISMCLDSNFRDTLLVLDACQNSDKIDDEYRSKIAPGSLGFRPGDPKDGFGVFCCYAATTLTRAPIINERGLLTAELIKALREVSNGETNGVYDVCSYDWTVGTAHLNFTPLYTDVVIERVKKIARDNNRSQRPKKATRGRFEEDDDYLLYPLPIDDPVQVTLKVKSPEGAKRLSIEQNKPIPVQLQFEDVVEETRIMIPNGADFFAACTPKTNWVSDPATHSLVPLKTDQSLTISMKPVTNGPTYKGVPYRLVHTGDHKLKKVVGPSAGEIVSIGDAMKRAQIPFIIKKMPQFGDKSIDIVARPAGPMGGGGGYGAMEGVFKGIDADPGMPWAFEKPWVPIEGKETEEDEPNLLFSVVADRESAGFGYLADRNVIELKPLSGPDRAKIQRLSPSVLTRMDEMRVIPGQYKITSLLPWGRRSKIIDVPYKGHVEVSIQPVDEPPPLRHRTALSEIARTSVSIHPLGLFGIDSLVSRPGAASSDELGELARLTDTFVLLHEETDLGERITPFSDIRHEAWDQIFALRDLEAVDLDDAYSFLIGLDFQDGQTSVFALGLAYAYWAQMGLEAGEPFLDCLDVLTPGFKALPDVTLLRNAALEQNEQVFGRPLLRWGVDLIAPKARTSLHKRDLSVDTALARYLEEELGTGFAGAAAASYHPLGEDLTAPQLSELERIGSNALALRDELEEDPDVPIPGRARALLKEFGFDLPRGSLGALSASAAIIVTAALVQQIVRHFFQTRFPGDE